MGPFLAKNLGTSISPWIVTMEALKPFKVENTPQDPKPLKYLTHSDPFNFDISLSVSIKPEGQSEATTICRSNYRHLYWTVKQQLAHHSITGCNVSIDLNFNFVDLVAKQFSIKLIKLFFFN